MPLSMYEASLPQFIHMLKGLSAVLDKAAAFAEAKKFNSEILVNARLAPDMYPLARQVHIATDLVKGCAARLSGSEVPSYTDTEFTIPELKARIAKTVAFVEGFAPAQFEGSEDRKVTLKLGGEDVTFQGRDYLFTFVIPNFYFHVTTAYAILRHNGLEIGKRDYLAA